MAEDKDPAFLDNVEKHLTRAGAVGAGLAAIFGAVAPGLGERGKQIAFAIAALLVAGAALAWWFRQRKERRTEIPQAPPASASAALRGLLPFVEGDTLLGRDADTAALLALIRSSDSNLAVLWGESGSGKTSLLRAGLMPLLRSEEYLPIYVKRPTVDPVEAIEAAAGIVHGAATPKRGKANTLAALASVRKSGPVVVILDQFEEFLLGRADRASAERFVDLILAYREESTRPVFFLISIREDYFARLQHLSPKLPEATSSKSSYALLNFTPKQAADLLRTSLQSDGATVDNEVVLATVNELEREGLVRPPELQIVGTHLKRAQIAGIDQYRALGGARGIIEKFVEDILKSARNRHLLSIVLRKMCHPGGLAKAPRPLSVEDLTASIFESSSPDAGEQEREVRGVLRQLEEARIAMVDEDGRWNLVHDYLAPIVLQTTSGAETETERSERIISRYLSEYRLDNRIVIPGHLLKGLRAPPENSALVGSDLQLLLRRSRRRAALVRYGPLAAVLALILLPYVFTLNYSHFGVEATRFTTEAPFVTSRLGHPSLRFLPFVRNRLTETEVDLEDFPDDDPALLERLRREEWSVGSWAKRGSYYAWQDELTRAMRPERQSDFRAMLGDDDVFSPLVEAAVRPGPGICTAAREARRLKLAPYAPGAPDLAALLRIVDDRSKGWRERTCAAAVVGALASERPRGSVPADRLLRLLGEFARTKVEFSSPDTFAKRQVVDIVLDLAPYASRGGRASALATFLAETVSPTGESFSDDHALTSVEALVAADPNLLTGSIVETVWNGGLNQSNRTLASFRRLRPDLFTPDRITVLAAGLASTSGSPSDFTRFLTLAAIADAQGEPARAAVRNVVGRYKSRPDEFGEAARTLYGALLADSSPLAAEADIAAGIRVVTRGAAGRTDEDFDIAGDANLVLWRLVDLERFGGGACDALLQRMIQVASRTSTDDLAPDGSSEAVMGAAMARNPACVTPRVVSQVGKGIADFRFSGTNMRFLGLLGGMADIRPREVIAQIDAMKPFPKSRLAQVEEAELARAVRARSLLRIERDKHSAADIAVSQIEKLSSRRREERRQAHYTLLHLALLEPSAVAKARQDLDALRQSPRPEVRVMAARTQRALAIAALANATGRESGVAELRLEQLRGFGGMSAAEATFATMHFINRHI